MTDSPLCKQCRLRPPSRPKHPFCSKACSNSARLVPLAERFSRYFRPAGPDECWPWQGTKDRDGYGVIGDERRRQLRAHRIAYERAFGPVQAGHYVLHRCDNRSCCNPNHLFAGTNSDNIADMVAKGRQARGPDNGNAKLTDDVVRRIKAALRANGVGKHIAAQYGVSEGIVSRIKVGHTWSHIK
jgi:hypothetical protein